MNIYEIGPVTGIPDENRPEFERVRHELIKANHLHVIIPHDFVPKETDWKVAMSLCIKQMMQWWNEGLLLKQKHRELGIALLDGWKQSRGAVIEYTLAQQLGIPCKPWKEWL